MPAAARIDHAANGGFNTLGAHLNLELDRADIPIPRLGRQRQPGNDGGVRRKRDIVRDMRVWTTHERDVRTAPQPQRSRPPDRFMERWTIRHRVDRRQSPKVRAPIAKASQAVAQYRFQGRHAIQKL